MSRPEQNIIEYSEEGIVTVPSRAGEAKIGIRRADWNRIKRSISNIPSEINVFQIVYTILFSVAGSIGISLIPIYTNPNAAPWVFPLYMWLAIFSFIVAVIFCILSRTMRKSRADYIQNIHKDIEEIENTFKIESETTTEVSEETSESG